MNDEDNIFIKNLNVWLFAIPHEPASDPKYIKHVHCDGARFHVLSWVGNSESVRTICSEPSCIINKKIELKTMKGTNNGL
jgi:hypothetical protein